MPSSTSSSEDPVIRPGLRVAWPLLAAALAFAVLLGGWEILLRTRGYAPHVEDTLEVWAHERRAADGDHRLVVVGSSRARAGLVPQVLEAGLPGWSVANLSLNGTSALPVLRSLAADRHFHGTVLCEVTPSTFFMPRGSPVAEQGTPEWAQRWTHLPWVTRVETPVAAWLQERLALLTAEANGYQLLRKLRERQVLPTPPRRPLMDARRYAPRDYTGVDRVAAEKTWTDKYRDIAPPDEATLGTHLAEIRVLVDAIEARGGRVVFLRMPASGTVLEGEERLFPRATSWDRLMAAGLRGLHFADVPALAGFTCPDGSHLDGRDGPAFTRALVESLRPLLAQG